MRKKMLAAALLPLPFAAIPLFAVVFAGTTAPGENSLVFETVPVFEVAPDLNVINIELAEPADQPLAYTSDGKVDCLEFEGGI